MLPQDESLNVLTEFLLEHGYHKVKGIPIFNDLSDICKHGYS